MNQIKHRNSSPNGGGTAIILFSAGAGVSTESNIPDFRNMMVFTKGIPYRRSCFSHEFYLV